MTDPNGKTTNSAPDGQAPSPAAASPATQASVTSQPQVQDILSKLPGADRQVLEQTFSLMLQTPMQNPILGKIDAEHLHKILDGVERDNERKWDDRDKGRKHNRILASIGLAGFIVISSIFLWGNQGALLKEVLVGFALFVGGLGAGAHFMRRKSED